MSKIKVIGNFIIDIYWKKVKKDIKCIKFRRKRMFFKFLLFFSLLFTVRQIFKKFFSKKILKKINN